MTPILRHQILEMQIKILHTLQYTPDSNVKNGSYSCHFVFSRSRLIPDNMTQPRAELYAALINTHTGEVVRRAFGKHHNNALKFTDSQIVLHWISNQNRPLKQWVHNNITEINRFTAVDQWQYIHTSSMIANIGAR